MSLSTDMDDASIFLDSIHTWDLSTQHKVIDEYITMISQEAPIKTATVIEAALRAVAGKEVDPHTGQYDYLNTLGHLERALESFNYAREQYDLSWKSAVAVPASTDPCGICMEAYDKHSHTPVQSILCGHVFGSGCILHTVTPFGDRGGTCPMCRERWASFLFPGWSGLASAGAADNYIDVATFREIAESMWELYGMLMISLQKCRYGALRTMHHHPFDQTTALMYSYHPDQTRREQMLPVIAGLRPYMDGAIIVDTYRRHLYEQQQAPRAYMHGYAAAGVLLPSERAFYVASQRLREEEERRQRQRKEWEDSLMAAFQNWHDDGEKKWVCRDDEEDEEEEKDEGGE